MVSKDANEKEGNDAEATVEEYIPVEEGILELDVCAVDCDSEVRLEVRTDVLVPLASNLGDLVGVVTLEVRDSAVSQTEFQNDMTNCEELRHC